ncbi:MAG TPA: MBL fold metallo-hydrolase [Candidatus Binatia bacterium]|jgi:L-ascorbate metabolism protein UlaG (beta-lactamase superfamily)
MRRMLAVSLFLFVLSPQTAYSSCRDLDVASGWIRSAYAAEPDVTIEFFGHNFFQITSSKGTKIITDPVAPGFYPTPEVAPHAVTVGREHPNHNYVELAKGKPIILRGLGNYGAEWNKISTTVRDILVYTVPVYQQQFGNALKGAAFVFDLGTICVAHLGDLSHKLTEEQIKAFGKVDIAMIPIGGTFTMPPDTAREVLQQLKPKIAIPMHYRESTYLLDMFVKGYPNKYLNTHIMSFSKTALPPPTQIIVFTPWGMRDYR